MYQARGLVHFCKSVETYTYVLKNLLLFQLERFAFLVFSTYINLVMHSSVIIFKYLHTLKHFY